MKEELKDIMNPHIQHPPEMALVGLLMDILPDNLPVSIRQTVLDCANEQQTKIYFSSDFLPCQNPKDNMQMRHIGTNVKRYFNSITIVNYYAFK